MWAVGGPDDDDAGDPLVDAVEMRVRPGRRGRRGAILLQLVDDVDSSDNDSGVPEDFMFQLVMPDRFDRDIELDSGIDEPIFV